MARTAHKVTHSITFSLTRVGERGQPGEPLRRRVIWGIITGIIFAVVAAVILQGVQSLAHLAH